ncbi:MAG TPA: TCP-1/cpn60 chaperonin family protein, partial [Thermoguttaceae bacterium]|nr:TCP-1/cpn60 chaperonin family protein [Thermoguttaceae bacterium]
AKCVLNVLDAPLRAIAQNAGLDGAVVVNRVRQMKNKTEGFDAERQVYCDLVDAGIIDPTKVVRTALQNAASVASLLLTTSALVTEIPKKEEKKGGRGGPGMEDMGGDMDEF